MGHKHTISFLGDMLRGSFTQAHQRDRRTIPAIVGNIDWDAPRRWMGAMEAFDMTVAGRVKGFRDLGADCPPFKTWDASEWLKKHDLHPEEALHYLQRNLWSTLVTIRPLLYSKPRKTSSPRRFIRHWARFKLLKKLNYILFDVVELVWVRFCLCVQNKVSPSIKELLTNHSMIF